MEKRFVLVVGSGVHHRVKDKQDPGLLASWELLLDAATANAEYPLGNRLLSPTARWEDILLGMVKQELSDENDSVPVNKKEMLLRKSIKKTIDNAIENYSVDEKKSRIFLHKRVSDLISLNFESSWLGLNKKDSAIPISPNAPEAIGTTAGMKVAAMIEKKRLYSRGNIDDDRCIWFPNGHVGDEKSLRLGFRDFGLQANALNLAYQEFKIWEKRIIESNESLDDVCLRDANSYEKVVNSFFAWRRDSREPEAAADHWVTAFMLLEPIFLGVGMTSDEQGLWWLLHQRARNLARVPSARPPRILKICPPCIEAEYGQFLSGSPVLEPIWCRTWDEGWDTVEAILAGKHD